MMIHHAYDYGDEFVEYQFQIFYRIIYDETDLDILFLSNFRKTLNKEFFFKFMKKRKKKENN